MQKKARLRQKNQKKKVHVRPNVSLHRVAWTECKLFWFNWWDPRPATPTFGLVADPFVNLIRSLMGPIEVQSPALAVEVGFVGGNKGLLHGETLVSEHAVGNQHNVLVGLSRQGLVQLPQHLVRPCADGGSSRLTSQILHNIQTLLHKHGAPYRFSCSGERWAPASSSLRGLRAAACPGWRPRRAVTAPRSPRAWSWRLAETPACRGQSPVRRR